jgi:hypothetical protein
MTNSEAGKLSHDMEYRINQAIPNGGELVSWEYKEENRTTPLLVGVTVKQVKVIVIIYKFNGELRRTEISCKLRSSKKVY